MAMNVQIFSSNDHSVLELRDVKDGVKNPGKVGCLKKKHLFERARRRKTIGGIFFTTKGIAETLQPGLESDNFKPRLKICIFNCISWLNGSLFGDDGRGFLREEVETYQMTPVSPRHYI